VELCSDFFLITPKTGLYLERGEEIKTKYKRYAFRVGIRVVKNEYIEGRLILGIPCREKKTSWKEKKISVYV
jgi:hypothetical protein